MAPAALRQAECQWQCWHQWQWQVLLLTAAAATSLQGPPPSPPPAHCNMTAWGELCPPAQNYAQCFGCCSAHNALLMKMDCYTHAGCNYTWASFCSGLPAPACFAPPPPPSPPPSPPAVPPAVGPLTGEQFLFVCIQRLSDRYHIVGNTANSSNS